MSGTLQLGCRFAFGAVLFALVLACSSPARLAAQVRQENPAQPVGVPARPERDPFFEAMRDVYRELTPNRELIELLWHEEVRTEIHLSDEKHQQIETTIGDGFRAVLELPQKEKEKLSREQWKEKILDIQRPIDEKLMDMLSDPQVADLDRLIGIYVQHRGVQSAANAAVAKRIGLNNDEFEAFRRARSEYWHRLMDENREKMGGLIRDGDRNKIAKLFEEAERKFQSQLASLLTDPQKSALKKLEGDQLEIPGQAFGFRGRGGGPRGDGPRRRGDGPRNDGQHNGGQPSGGGRPGDQPERDAPSVKPANDRFVDCRR